MLTTASLILSDMFAEHVNQGTVHPFDLAVTGRVVAFGPRLINSKHLKNFFNDSDFGSDHCEEISLLLIEYRGRSVG